MNLVHIFLNYAGIHIVDLGFRMMANDGVAYPMSSCYSKTAVDCAIQREHWVDLNRCHKVPHVRLRL